MNLETFKQKFEVIISGIKYNTNGHKSEVEQKDSIDFTFTVKHKFNKEVKQFQTAYVVEDTELDMKDHAKNAFSIVQTQIFDWASLVENKSPLEGSILQL